MKKLFVTAKRHRGLRVPFLTMKNNILGKGYTLSVVFTSAAHMRKLNRTYRKKNTPTDILSFPLSKRIGEMYVSLSEVAGHAKKFSMTARQYLPYLVIHGMLHLKGHRHGRTMERLERKFCRAFRIPFPS